MPRKKSKKVKQPATKAKTNSSPSQILFEQLKLNESYTSLILGVIVVILVGSVVMVAARSRRGSESFQSQKTAVEGAKTDVPQKYTVVAGDDLKKISQKIYKTTDYATDIAKINNITNPDTLTAGTVLILPKKNQNQSQKVTTTPNPTGNIASTTYTVQGDESLWDIAVRSYGDGYRWPDIAKANNLTDPDQISSGMVLKIPR
ncbi:MAG TPA: LysM domain-containing protein [Candidatus Saccharimonadales bacterium]|nr:LysM domain-containing protein [Candidatus Saccharimonadales bacterium]